MRPYFRLTAASFQVKRGDVNGITLQCTNGVNAGAIVVTPSDGIPAPVVSGSTVTIKADASAALGVRRVVVDDAAGTGHKSRRTIEIIA